MLQNSGRIVAVALSIVALIATAGCSTQGVHAKTAAATSHWPVDPIVQLRDKSHDFYTDATPVLHRRGTGTKTFTLKSVPAGTTQITYYVSCSPSSHYQVTMGKNFDGPCANVVQNSGGIPLASTGEVKVKIKLPAKTSFYIVGIPDSN
ncbi:hypothetical protein QP157_21165 [Sphingomonas sp. LR61]|uniref:hypothetical protein n=1 Tax=Sphingomonas sp. LR61 TaxID=3050234 RepID=UPI002FDF0C41